MERVLVAIALAVLLLLTSCGSARGATDLGYIDHAHPERLPLAAAGDASVALTPMPPLDQLDLYHAEALRHGLDPVYRLNPCDDPAWADGVDRRYPEATFQIGNEPDLRPAASSSCGPWPRDIRAQLKMFWRVAEEPGIAPALSGCKGGWLRAFKRHRINRWSRAIALNLYPGLNVNGRRAAARCARRAHRVVGGPVWITEVGVPLGHTKADGRRAARIYRTLNRVRAVKVIAWYRLVDYPGPFRWDPSAGALTATLDPKPAYYYLRNEAR